jgi:hypothetical protein
LILDTDITLRGDITATNKVIGTVAGLEYTYTYSSQTLIISKTSGTFAAEDVAKVVESIKLKNTDTDSQLGGSAYKAPTIKSSKPSPLTSPALETEMPLKSPDDSPLITKPRCALLA